MRYILNGLLENKMGCLLTQVTDDSSTMIVLIFCTPDFSTKTIKNSKSDQFGAQIVSKFLEKNSTFSWKNIARKGTKWKTKN